MGCGFADGSNVMNVTNVHFYLGEEGEALVCEKSVGCSIIMGGKYSENIFQLLGETPLARFDGSLNLFDVQR